MSFSSFFTRYSTYMLLLISVIVGCVVYTDYGISWDEFQQHSIGSVNYDYIKGKNKDLETFRDKDYGTAFELGLIYLEYKFHIRDFYDLYILRHFFTHLFYLFGAFFMFLLVDLLYKNKILALIAYSLILLHPLFYAHSFFNTKDIPFAMMFIICFYFSALAFKTYQWYHFALLGITTGLLVNMRIMGVILICALTFFLLLDLFFYRREKKMLLMGIGNLILFLSLSSFTLYLTWPFLWGDPIGHFKTAFENMSKFRWESSVLFYGVMTKSSELPWYYPISWFSISNPVLNLIFGLTGACYVCWKFIKKPLHFLQNRIDRNQLLYLFCFFGPLFSVIILDSVLYDSWRQLFFIYPSFVLLAIAGLHGLLKGRYKQPVYILNIINFAFILFFMVKSHPFQHIYFNALTDRSSPERLRSKFELDYWGTSYKQAFEYILSHDKRKLIKVADSSDPVKRNLLALPPEMRKRIQLVNINDADYFTTTYRWHPQEYEEFRHQKWHSIKVGNNTINGIYKLK